MNPVQRIITLFGTQARVAEVAGVKQHTVSYWKEVGHVPAKHHAALLAGGRALGLRPEHFFADEDARA